MAGLGASWCMRDCDLIAELTKSSGLHLGMLFLFPRTHFPALLDKSHLVMQDSRLRDRADGQWPRRLIAEAGHKTAEPNLKMTAFFRDRSMRGLVQHSTQILIAFGRATAMVLLRAFVSARNGSHPSRQLRRRSTGLRPCLGDDLLRRIRSQARYFRQSDHGVLVGLHGLRDHG